MTINDNFNKLADEHDKLRQQFHVLEAKFFNENAELKDEIKCLKFCIKNCDD